MADRAGEQLGHYRLVRLLGRGGFAEVYLGEHLRLKTQAAIKVLHTSLEEGDVEGFLREAQTVARLKHPHIVRVFDFDVQDHTPFLVMDYMPNGSARRLYPKGTSLPLETIVASVKQVASALQYAHDQKVIHRDVKPENMLLDQDDTIVLSDFGTALMAQSSRYQSTQEVAGTAAYMAPEQFQGHPHRASDQYALGVVVYEWLSGDRPFHGSFSEIASQHMFVPPPPLKEKVPAISPEVEQVVLTALEKDPHKRFGSVQAFAAALEQACAPCSHLVLPIVAPVPGQSALSEVIPNYRLDQVPRQEEVVSQQPQRSVAETLHAIYDETSEKNVELVPNLLTSPGITPAAQVPQPYDAASQQTTPVIRTPPRINEMPEMLGRKRRVSRRQTLLILGLTGLTVTGIVGWVELTHRSPASSGNPSLKFAVKPGTTLYTYRGHTDKVNSVAWSLDGKSIASGSADGTVQIWDAMTGNRHLTYRGHKAGYWLTPGVFSVAWSPDGKFIASGGTDETVQIWDAMTGNRQVTYGGHHTVQGYNGQPQPAIYSVVWSPDGRSIASGGTDETVQVWDAMTGTRRLSYRGHQGVDFPNGIFSVAWSPDGKSIASGDADGTVQVWDAMTGTRRLTYTGNYRDIRSVAWSPDGKSIASGGINQGGGDNSIQVWDAMTGTQRLIYPGWTYSIAWSPDSKSIASGSAVSTVQVWDAMTGDTRLTYTGPRGEVLSVAWSPDGKSIASGDVDGTIQVWQVV